jgi:hypothetical protein
LEIPDVWPPKNAKESFYLAQDKLTTASQMVWFQEFISDPKKQFFTEDHQKKESR